MPRAATKFKLLLLAGCLVFLCLYFLQIGINANPTVPNYTEPVTVPQKYSNASWTLIIGVVLKASNFERRNDIRKSYINFYEDVYCPYCEKSRHNSPKVRVFFFIGHEEKWFGEAKLEEAIREEQRKYDDIVYLEHIKENMDEGKTFEMFSWIANNLNSQYVMKADDDSYIIIPNILKRLSEVENMFSSPDYGVYYGYILNPGSSKVSGSFMAGMGYIMSHDILNYITTTKDVNKIGFEDHVVADAVHQYVNANLEAKNNKKVVFIGDRIRFHDFPSYKGPVSWELNCNDIVIHQLKSDSHYQTTHSYFSNCCSNNNADLPSICIDPPKSKTTCSNGKYGRDCMKEMYIRIEVEPGYEYIDDCKYNAK